MSETASISTGIASRYATAVFDLAKEGGELDKLETDLSSLESALADSEDFRELIGSPVYSREEQQSAIAALARAMALSDVMTNTLRLMAAKRRLFVLPALVQELKTRVADEKGEIIAEVTAAKSLTKAQQDKLAKVLKASVGKTVNINLAVDESLIGGLIVKVGSKMIDTTIASKLAKLQNAMKEVG